MSTGCEWYPLPGRLRVFQPRRIVLTRPTTSSARAHFHVLVTRNQKISRLERYGVAKLFLQGTVIDEAGRSHVFAGVAHGFVDGDLVMG